MPTCDIQVAASADDCYVYYYSSAWAINLVSGNMLVGDSTAVGVTKQGGGFRFLNVPIPQYSLIYKAYITITSLGNQSSTNMYTRLTGDKEASAATFTTIADYQARRGTAAGGGDNTKRTTAQVEWDGMPPWTDGVQYNSPDISTIVQEIVNQATWVNSNNMVIFWDDHDGRSGANLARNVWEYDSFPGTVLIHIEWIDHIYRQINPLMPILAQ
jgi:hypothetical protein